MAKKVLVVDDEKLIVKGIRFSLEQDGMEVTCAYDGEEALQCAKEQKFDMILLDIMLPKLSGTEVCQQIREFSDVPIVMLTAKNDDMDKIMGLEYGADDYITKPFNILEVKARIKAIMRRTSARGQIAKPESILESGDMRVDCESRRVSISGREVNLTAKEFDLLELLIRNPNKVYSREKLLNLVWGADYPGDVRTVDVHIQRTPLRPHQMGSGVLFPRISRTGLRMKNGELSACRKVRRFSDGNPVSNANRTFAKQKVRFPVGSVPDASPILLHPFPRRHP